MMSAGCTKNVNYNEPDRMPVLIALLKEHEPVKNLQFTLFSSADNVPEQIIENQLTIAKNNEAPVELVFVNGSYQTNANFIIENNTTYHIQGFYNERAIAAACTLPPAIANLQNIESDTIAINPDPPIGFPSYILSWNSLDTDRYSYVLDLELLEPDSVLIPFEIEAGLFAEKYNGPTPIPALTLFENDFKYYGLHKLTVYAIDKSYEAIYFYSASDLRGLLKNGPDNVQGAKGFVTGVSSFSIELFIE
jgi:hypothetical protein